MIGSMIGKVVLLLYDTIKDDCRIKWQGEFGEELLESIINTFVDKIRCLNL